MVLDEENPYQSPKHVDAGLLRQRPLRPGAQGRLLAKGLLYRRVLIEAPVEATLEFDGRSLRDVIRIDNQIVSWRFSWWRITPYFRFALPAGDHELDVEVLLNLGTFLRILGFCIRIEGQVAYSEGSLQ